ncbi:MAG: NifB/NifX family molybdenum-iron cluster-binding protein [Ignavibacteriales bacterium]|nr:NifB/NifX family molybdenum-iron cluster-binding protein [Ignavibacteriales bacterium]
MLIAVTSSGDSFDSLVNERFGRCQFFLIVDPDTMKLEAVPNPAEKAQGGAGPKAAEVLINKGVNILLTSHVGDKAEEALKRGNIKIVSGLSSKLKVTDAITNYLSKQKEEK